MREVVPLKVLVICRRWMTVWHATLLVVVAVAAWLVGGEAAQASCDPAAGSNITATCTGATNNQGGGAPGTSGGTDGYGTGAETNLNVTVVPGASVTGAGRGIFFDTGSVANFGTISGVRGIEGVTAANVNNSGSISGSLEGISATTASVTNSGIITGGQRGIVTTGTVSVINSGTISATIGVGVDGQTANVTNSGTISGPLFGITASTANVTNSGTISGGEGIAAGIANVSNSGTISGTDFGIRAVTTANVTNSGIISASVGIDAITANVTNSGSISGVRGIEATAANVNNSGSISGSLEGIIATTASVTNSGIITGRQRGIVTTGTVSVINSGTISATVGVGVEGQTANVTNSGTISGPLFGITASTANVSNSGIISGGIAALQFAGNPDTLTLLPGSRIIGAINLAGGGDTVNFRGGNHNLTFDTLAGATVTGTTPFVVSGNRAVAIDPTPFAMADRNLMDFSRMISAVIPEIETAAAGTSGSAPLAFSGSARSAADVVGDTFAAAIPSLSAYAGETAVLGNPTAVYAGGTTVWARGFAGKRVQEADGVLLRTENQFYGGMLGAEWQAGPNWRLGLFAGGGETKSSLDLNYGETKSTLVFGSAYARYRLANAFLYLAVQGGRSGNDTQRRINNNLVAGGIETATASFDGWYVSPEAHFGIHHALGTWGGAAYTLSPSLRVRYLYASFDGYTESGSSANLTVGRRSVQDFEERGELKLTRTETFGATAAIATSIYGGVLAVQRVGNTTVDAALLGQAIPFATPGENNVWGGYGGAGLAWRAERITVFGAAEYTALSDNSAIVSGRAGLRVTF
ncbi:MAG: autotransporter domain-containing protein [Xanthobacteraceae bacterium]|nr:autotransporter domain-containing protein [Xanthobacteraceae bacterium]